MTHLFIFVTEIALLASMPLASDLIADAYCRPNNYHMTVKVFLARFLGLASNKELHFVKMFAQIGDKVTNDFKEINSPAMNSSLRVAYLDVALALVNHESGISWLLQKEVWKDVMALCSQKMTVFVVRKVYEFVSKFLWQLNDMGDEPNIYLVLSHILEPIGQIDIINVLSVSDDHEEEICKRLDPLCHMLLAIFSDPRMSKTSTIVNKLITEFFVPNHFSILINRLRNEETIGMLMKIVFWVTFAKIFQSKPLIPGAVYTKDDFLEINAYFFNTLQFLLKRRNVKMILNFCNACSMVWNVAWQGQKPVLSEDSKKLDVQNQILFINKVPLLAYLFLGRSVTEMLSEERLNNYISTILTSSSEHTARAAYGLRDLMCDSNVLETVMLSVKMLTCMKSHFSDEQANLVFQGLFFILKDYIPVDEQGRLKENESFSDNPEKITVMTYVMEIVLSLVKDYNINWKESLEILCLYSVVHYILGRPNLPPKVSYYF